MTSADMITVARTHCVLFKPTVVEQEMLETGGVEKVAEGCTWLITIIVRLAVDILVCNGIGDSRISWCKDRHVAALAGQQLGEVCNLHQRPKRVLQQISMLLCKSCS